MWWAPFPEKKSLFDLVEILQIGLVGVFVFLMTKTKNHIFTIKCDLKLNSVEKIRQR